MDFEVTIRDDLLVTDQFHDALTFIKEKMAQWNNYDPSLDLEITVKKIPSKTETLGVDVGDVLDISEMLG